MGERTQNGRVGIGRKPPAARALEMVDDVDAVLDERAVRVSRTGMMKRPTAGITADAKRGWPAARSSKRICCLMR